MCARVTPHWETRITAERIEVINALKKTNARFSYVDKKGQFRAWIGKPLLSFICPLSWKCERFYIYTIPTMEAWWHLL
jgi:hypothetical protein